MRRATSLALCLSVLAVLPCLAWEDHAQLSYLSLGREAWAGEPVQAESLERFLEAEKAGLAALLRAFETRATKELDYYPPLPDALGFKGEGEGAALRAAFVAAIRLNPESKLRLYVKPSARAARTRPPLRVDEVDPFDCRFENAPFELLVPGGALTALEAVATASDEPDYGLDCGLYEDNKTAAGSLYGLGAQPFGNAALEYGSQAPLHMAFAHEDPIIGLAAPYTKRSLADYRFRLFGELSRFAFARGHRYWGYRFAGWALHYVQDLCQPYHSSLMPGRSTVGLLALNVFGSKADIDAAMIFLSNRHSLVEDYAYRAVAARSPGAEGALASGALAKGEEYRSGWLYDAVAARAKGRGGRLDGLLVALFPARYVADPSYDYGLSNVGATREFDPYAASRAGPAAEAASLDGLFAETFADLGAYGRAFMAYALDPAAVAGPRRAPLDLRGPLYALALAALAALVAWGIVSGRRRRRVRDVILRGGVI